MTAATPAEQRRLMDLQAGDTAIRMLQHRRTNLQEQKALDENAELLGRIALEHQTKREQLDRLASQQRRHEAEVAAIDARRKTEEGRMYSGLIKHEKELEALRHEIGGLKGKKSDLEDSLLEIMEQREELESLVASLEERQSELTASLAELTAARDHAAGDIDAELVTRSAEREAAIAELDASVLRVYDDVRKRKGDVAAAVLNGRSCGGCRLELTAIEMEEWRAESAASLSKCPQCGRILIRA